MPPRGEKSTLARPGRFPRVARLTHKREFEAVYLNKLRKTAYPLVIFFAANRLPTPRLGLAVHRRLGTAVLRNTLKRRTRDAFRQIMPQLKSGERCLDLIVQFRPVDPAPTVEECKAAILSAAAAAWREIHRRERESGDLPPDSLERNTHD